MNGMKEREGMEEKDTKKGKEGGYQEVVGVL